MTANIVALPARTIRGLNYLPNGQQCSTYLPKGEYDILGEVNLNYSDHGQLVHSKCTQLVNIANGEKWYIGTMFVPTIERDYKRELGNHPD